MAVEYSKISRYYRPIHCDKMVLKSRRFCVVPSVFLMVLVLFVCGCNHSAYRISGSSLPFAEMRPSDKPATSRYPYTLVVSSPIDKRPQHYREFVAGTKWDGCTSDPFWGWDASQMIQQRVVKEFEASGLFSKVSTVSAASDDVIMKTEIHSFCSKSVGCLYIHVVGVISLRVTLEQNGKVFLDRKFERVVTDADIEYTRAEVGFIKKAMFFALVDSLRQVLIDLREQTEADSEIWKQNS
jgi:hypothetical protein